MVGRAYGTYGAEEKCVLGFDVETKWERSPWRHRRRWENNIKMHFKEIRWDGVNWMHLAQDRGKRRDLVNTICFKRTIRIIINRAINILSNRCTSWYNKHGRHKLYMFRHRGSIFRELLEQRCTSQRASVCFVRSYKRIYYVRLLKYF